MSLWYSLAWSQLIREELIPDPTDFVPRFHVFAPVEASAVLRAPVQHEVERAHVEHAGLQRHPRHRALQQTHTRQHAQPRTSMSEKQTRNTGQKTPRRLAGSVRGGACMSSGADAVGSVTRGWEGSAVELACLQLREQFLNLRVGQIQAVAWASALMGLNPNQRLRSTQPSLELCGAPVIVTRTHLAWLSLSSPA